MTRSVLPILLACLIPLSGGCRAVRDARKTQDPARIPPGERTPTAAEIGLATDAPLTLEGAIAIAAKYHPSVIEARQNTSQADQQFKIARARYLPSVETSASYRRSTANAAVATETGRSANSYSADVSGSQLLYDFGKTPAAVRKAAADARAAAEHLCAEENNAAYRVRLAFFERLKFQALLEAVASAETQAEARLAQTRALTEAGSRIANDVIRAEVDLGNAKLARLDTRNALTSAIASLNQALGLAEAPAYPISDPPAETMIPQMETLMAAARKHNPDLAALRARTDGASAAVDASIADLWPSLSLSGNYGLGGSRFPLVWNWALAGSAGMTLLDGSRRTNAISAAAMELRAARARYAAAEQAVYLDLSRAAAGLESAAEKSNVARTIVRQAEENARLTEERYTVGRASSVERTDGASALIKAKADEIQARFDYAAAIAGIRHITGETR
ncbi:MAG: TolC family protein [Planctomycetota bacterium]